MTLTSETSYAISYSKTTCFGVVSDLSSALKYAFYDSKTTCFTF